MWRGGVAVNLQDLLTRAYLILGDDIATPRWFTRARLVDLLNRACLEFRSEVEDEWISYDQALTAGTDVYTFRDDHLRTQRVAYSDLTLETIGAVGTITSRDERWQSHDGATPLAWSSDALPHNQYRLLPTPSVSSADFYTFSGEYGDMVDLADTSGTYTFASEYGLVLEVPDFTNVDEYGAIVEFGTQGSDLVNIWATGAPGAMSGDGDEVPIKAAFANAPVWYALWRTYEGEGDHHNKELAGLYRKLWRMDVDRAKELAEIPLPRIPNVINPSRGGDGRRGLFRPSDTVGGSYTVTW